MKKILIILVASITLLSFSTIFSKPNPNTTSSVNSLSKIERLHKNIEATPEVIKDRIEAMSGDIKMSYNADVQAVIDRYLKYNGKQIADLLGKAEGYLPIFERALKEAGLPEQLKYIPVIESNLETKATSNRGAGGLWQFMPVTAKGYDMKITSTIDERYDPYLASEKACAILKDLYDKFGDWTLALAAYNAGPGTLRKALKRAGGEPKSHTFWTVYSYLPAQTRKYVPKFIALTYLMTYYDAHNITKPETDRSMVMDTIRISGKTQLSAMAKKVGLSLSELRTLNPHLRSDMIPASEERPCNLILPADVKANYSATLTSAFL